MGLRDAATTGQVVKTSGGEFAVRGLGYDDIAFLVKEHRVVATSLFERFGSVENPETKFGEMLNVALDKAPDILAHIVALGVDEDERFDEKVKLVRRLSVSTQTEALERIGKLTFEQEGGAKKVFETAVQIIQGMTGLLAVE